MIFRNGIWVGCLFVATLGCGSKQGDDDKSPASTGGNGGSSGTTGGAESGGSSGGTSTGGTSTGGTGAAGSAGKPAGDAGAGSSGGGTAGSGTNGTCTNTFGTPELLIPDTPGVLRQSLTVTGDDLELYYEERRSDAAHVMVRKRTNRNALFADATELDPSIWSWCAPIVDPSLDVSDDGLRLYLTCVDTSVRNADGGYTASLIRAADRPAREAVLSLNPADYGKANVSFSVTQDELTAYWSDYSTTTTPELVMATRTSTAGQFGPPMLVPGISDSVRNPELANDGLHLFGSVEASDGTLHIVMYTRAAATGAFSPLTASDVVVQPVGTIPDDPSTTALEGVSDYTPTVSGDCKSLYFMRRSVRSDGTATSEIFVAKR